MNLDVSVKGEARARLHLDDVGDRAKDPKAVLNRIADTLQSDQAANFRGQGSMFGGWAPNAPATLERKGSSRPLVATGALEQSLQKGRGKGKVRRVTKTRVTLGTSLFYGRFHQAGTSRGVPQRKIVGIRPVRTRLAVKMLERYIAEGRF